jgi:hypothetical protein
MQIDNNQAGIEEEVEEDEVMSNPQFERSYIGSEIGVLKTLTKTNNVKTLKIMQKSKNINQMRKEEKQFLSRQVSEMDGKW